MKKRKKLMHKLPQKINFLVFFGLLLFLPIATAVSPKLTFSETENRVLASMPKLTFDNVVERKYMNGVESYFADHFAGRDGWISTKTGMELALGKKESNGVYILDDMLIQKIEGYNPATPERSITAINNFAEDNPDIKTFVMIVPTSAEIYKEKLPENAPNVEQKETIEEFYSAMSGKITTLDAYSALNAEKDGYIYYRNDHHWTTAGAYCAYSATIKKMGHTAVPMSEFNIEHASSDFKGTLYSKAVYDGVDADVLDIYHNKGGNSIDEVIVQTGLSEDVYDDLYFRDYLEVKDKYSVFCGSNQPIVTIKTNNENGGKLLVIKDSYANCYVPFLAQHYSEITMLDMRYIDTKYENIVNIDEYDQALFLYNFATFIEDENIKKLDF